MATGEFAWECLKAIGAGKIDCLVIGRQAMALYGCPTATQDVDLLVATPDMSEGLKKLACDFGLELILEETGRSFLDWLRREPPRTLLMYAEPEDIPHPDPLYCRRLDILICGKLGVFYETASRRSVAIEIEPGTRIRIPHVDDLIAMKRVAGRAKDREDLAWLRQHRDLLIQKFSGESG